MTGLYVYASTVVFCTIAFFLFILHTFEFVRAYSHACHVYTFGMLLICYVYMQGYGPLYKVHVNNFYTLQETQHTGDFLIKPSSDVQKLDTSEWPLLLKVSTALAFTGILIYNNRVFPRIF